MLQGHDDREYTSLFVLHTMSNKLIEHEISLGNKIKSLDNRGMDNQGSTVLMFILFKCHV